MNDVFVVADARGLLDPRNAAYAVLRPFYNERYRDLFDGELGLKQSVLQLIGRLIEVKSDS